MPDSPATPRLAATVVAVRPGTDGLEVLVQSRPGTMSFAAGKTVFPGGAVDDGDERLGLLALRHNPSRPVDWWSDAFACTEPGEAAGFIGAALRETFEEVGILFAEPAQQTPDHSRVVEGWRSALLDASTGRADLLASFITDSAWRITLDTFTPWARWITPLATPKRFDAAFFLTTVATHAEPQHDERVSEIVTARWASPQQLLDECRDGTISLMPPTFQTLTDLAASHLPSDIPAPNLPLTPTLGPAIRRDG